MRRRLEGIAAAAGMALVAALADSDRALPFAELHAHCRVRAATLHERIGALSASGRIVKGDGGWRPAGQP